MKTATTHVIEAVLAGDPSVSELQREGIIALAKNKPVPTVALLLTQREVADLLGVSRQYVWRLARDGLLTPLRINGGAPRYRRSDILKLIEGAA